ncbi:MAG: FimB/Mfa2 family fimbrial subunit [Flavobacteriales bacterium]|nr:FimB/Mfa2 family fimbrial subunit [Flavobacteriales bacterium]
MKKYFILAFLILFICACQKRAEVVPALAIGLENKTEDTINDITVWIFSSDVLLKTYTFPSSDVMAETPISLPIGKYKVVCATNIKDAFIHSSKEEVTKIEDLFLSVKDPSALLNHSHFASKEVEMKDYKITQCIQTLSRAMSELSITISGVPSEVTSINAEVVNSADGYFPATEKLSHTTKSTPLGTVAPANGSVIFPKKLVMPVIDYNITKAASDIKTVIHFTIYYSNGGVLDFYAEMPQMINGGQYESVLKYSDFRVGVTLEITEINGWKESEPINGEILNPRD